MPNHADTRHGQISRRMAALLFAAVFALQSGCANFPPRPPEAPVTQYQAALGKVAVIATAQQPEIEFKGVVGGKGEGTAKGAGMGIGRCIGSEGIVLCAIPPLCVVFLGVCGTTGAVVGGVAAPGAEEVRTAETAISTALAVKIVQEALREQVVAAATARGGNLVSVPPESAQAAAQKRDYRSLAAAGVDTVFEVTLTKVGAVDQIVYGHERKGSGFNPPLFLSMTAHVRLIRTRDNAEVFAADYVFLGERLTVSEWSANQAERLLHNLRVGYQTLGAHIYDSVFLLYPFPDRKTPQSAGFMANAFGLPPLYPRLSGPAAEEDVFFLPPSHWKTVDSLQPTFRWQSFPRPIDIKAAPDEMERVRNVRYDLIIAQEHNLGPADAVYRREGLPDPMHTIETSLKPATRYFWTVRARFELDGRERVTEWSTVDFWFQGKWTSPSPASYRFKTPK